WRLCHLTADVDIHELRHRILLELAGRRLRPEYGPDTKSDGRDRRKSTDLPGELEPKSGPGRRSRPGAGRPASAPTPLRASNALTPEPSFAADRVFRGSAAMPGYGHTVRPGRVSPAGPET